MAGKFELKKAKNGQFMFNLKASNGEIILTSEMYKAKIWAKNGIDSVKKNAKKDESFKPLISKKGDPYFVLRAGNNQVIGTSETYLSESAMKNGMDSVKKTAPGAAIEDLTK